MTTQELMMDDDLDMDLDLNLDREDEDEDFDDDPEREMLIDIKEKISGMCSKTKNWFINAYHFSIEAIKKAYTKSIETIKNIFTVSVNAVKKFWMDQLPIIFLSSIILLLVSIVIALAAKLARTNASNKAAYTSRQAIIEIKNNAETLSSMIAMEKEITPDPEPEPEPKTANPPVSNIVNNAAIEEAGPVIQTSDFGQRPCYIVPITWTNYSNEPRCFINCMKASIYQNGEKCVACDNLSQADSITYNAGIESMKVEPGRSLTIYRPVYLTNDSDIEIRFGSAVYFGEDPNPYIVTVPVK